MSFTVVALLGSICNGHELNMGLAFYLERVQLFLFACFGQWWCYLSPSIHFCVPWLSWWMLIDGCGCGCVEPIAFSQKPKAKSPKLLGQVRCFFFFHFLLVLYICLSFWADNGQWWKYFVSVRLSWVGSLSLTFSLNRFVDRRWVLTPGWHSPPACFAFSMHDKSPFNFIQLFL